MLVIIKPTPEDVSSEAARIVANAIRTTDRITLGLATGRTTLGLYAELVRLHREEDLSFRHVVSFNLDEYVGLAHDDPRSYHFFMDHHLFDHVDIDMLNVHLPDGTTHEDYETYCAGYERAIEAAGGIDLQILGLGRDGHIGFNEPTSSLGSRTRVKTLTEETLRDNWGEAQADDVPQCAITMGIGTIMEARKILLLASGTAKAAGVARSLEGPVTASVTGSVLQLHRDVTVVVDEEAASALSQRGYYKRVMEMTARVTPS